MKLRFALILFAACSAPADHPLPGAAIPAQLARTSSIACGIDISYRAGTTDIRYRYTYDELGRLARATGAYTAGGADDVVDYTYDNLDQLTHKLESRGWGNVRNEITANYDSLGDLIEYTSDVVAPGYHEVDRYAFLDFTDAGLPTRELIGVNDEPELTYRLDYDTAGRIMQYVEDGGPTTTYTYDDTGARTITIDTGGGAFHGVIAYDDQDHELSETWGGSDPQAVPREDTYVWDGDRLTSATYRQAGAIEVDTPRYDCPR